MLRADQRVNERLAERLRASVEGQPAGLEASSSSGSGGAEPAPTLVDEGRPRGPADVGCLEGPEESGLPEGAGYPPEGMSVAGDVVFPEEVADDVDEEMHFL
eukprot:15476598-Alexandrium_andersonii.AAC.1